MQKHLDIPDLSEDEVKGRWKSFVPKWNAGVLAEGWYDPALKERADARAAESGSQVDKKPQHHDREVTPAMKDEANEDSSDDAYGPALPESSRKSGPVIPSLQDLQDRQELNEEDRAAELSSLRQSRKEDRALQKSRLDELAPRADPGTRERQLEKKRETAASNRAFAEAKEGGAMEEVGDGDLMGDDGVDGYKKRVKEQERKKSEREVRKEEVLRARAAEREERMAKARGKEEKTMGMLREIARQRFGGGGGDGT